jgi:putative sigma-54 modulation protein
MRKIMHIHLSPRHVRLTAALHAHAAGVVAALEDYTEIFAAHLVLIHDEAAKPADRNTVKAHIAIRGNDVHAEDTAETIQAALDGVGAKLARQLRKRKTRLTDKRRSKLQRAREKQRGR